jgi:dUTP pyrophosphatase
MNDLKRCKIKIVNSSPYPTPTYATPGSAGVDLQANLPAATIIAAGSIVLIPTGLSIALPAGMEAQIRSRSGMTLKHGIVVANGVGTIDSDYRGEIKVILHNCSQTDYNLQPGEKIAQMIIAPYLYADFEETDTLDETLRGSGGFGHSGK